MTENKYCISIQEYIKEHGFTDEHDLIQTYADSSVVPALCTEDCEVEPDRNCQHGCPSILLAAGLI